jgi:stage III sporulation protein AC
MPLPGRDERDIHCGAVAVEEVYMSVNLIFKIAAVGILVSVLSQVLKHSGREEHAFLTSLAGLLLVLFWIVPYIYDLFESIQRLFAL